ncbi:MAG: cytochrome c biogenesis protein ResB [Myxococcaceae bacterium]|nr:cytochrome c biogenesis protein ResB [Myxococcaceae bacterium]
MSVRLLLGTLCAGLLVQLLVPAVTPPVVLAVGLLSALVWTALGLSRDRLGALMAQGTLTALSLFALAAFAILGTFLPQNRPAAFYRDHLGEAFAALAALLGLTDLFHGTAFAALLGLLAATLVVTTWRLRALSPRFLAIATANLGCLLVLAGSAVSFVFAEHARIDLRVGAPAVTQAERTQRGRPTGEKVDLGAQVRLVSFAVERSDQKPLLVRYSPTPEGGWRRVESFQARRGERRTLTGGARVEVKELFEDFAWEDRVEPAVEGPHALRVEFAGQSRWLVAGDPCLSLKAEDAWVAAEADRAASFEVCLGSLDVPVAGHELPKTASGLSFSSNTLDPSHHAHAMRAMMRSQAEARLTIDVKQSRVRLMRAGRFEELPLEEGMRAHGLRVERVLPASRRDRLPTSRSSQMRSPAVRLAIDEGARRDEALLVAENRDAVRLDGGDALALELGGDDITDFQSQLDIVDEKGVRHSRLLKVNAPIEVNGWRLYQSRFDPEDADFAGLEAIRDRGVFIVFWGFALLLIGVVLLVPWPARRDRAGEAANNFASTTAAAESTADTPTSEESLSC